MAKGGSTTQTTMPDAGTQAYINQVRGAAQAAAGTPGPGANPLTQGAGNFYSGGMGAGNVGFGALSGNPGDVSQLMNPYLSQVTGTQNKLWQTINAQTGNAVDANATQNGAFGGSRAAIAKASALSQNNATQAAQNAQLLQGGYSQAMGQAGQLANLGMGSASGASSIGDYLRNVGIQTDPNIWRMSMLQQGMAGMPTGQTTTQTQRPGSNPFSGALGGAAAGSAFGPWGAGIGAGVGLLGSM